MGGLTLPSAQLVQKAWGKDGATRRRRNAIPWTVPSSPHGRPRPVPEQTDVHVGCLGNGSGEAEHLFIYCTAILREPVFRALGTKSLPSRNRNSRDSGDTG